MLSMDGGFQQHEIKLRVAGNPAYEASDLMGVSIGVHKRYTQLILSTESWSEVRWHVAQGAHQLSQQSEKH